MTLNVSMRFTCERSNYVYGPPITEFLKQVCAACLAGSQIPNSSSQSWSEKCRKICI
jgi:hypothetical protein